MGTKFRVDGMFRRIAFGPRAVLLGFALTLPVSAAVAEMPDLRLSGRNAVAECVTSDKLEAFLGAKTGGKLDPRFKGIAALYKEHGTASGIRWDYAFFQMMVETNALSFRSARGRNSELSADLNNFVSIAKPGRNEGLERFKDVSQGVLAHMHHVRLYSGDPVDKPVARRTRDVQSFLQPWAKSLGRPVNFADLAARWAPQDKEYASRIEETAQEYRKTYCGGLKTDPSVASRKKPAVEAKVEDIDAEEQQEVKRSSRSKKGQRNQRRKSREGEETESASQTTRPPVLAAEVKQATKSDEEDETPEEVEAKAKLKSEQQKPTNRPVEPEKSKPVLSSPTKTASVTPAIAPQKAPELPVAKDKVNCRVWTASFGGDRAILLKVVENGLASYTALEVNGTDAEAQTLAFVSAYAKGGIKIGEFGSREDALARAFELCPQG